MTWAQDQRAEFIANRLKTEGFIQRKHIVDKFSISIAQASLDLRWFIATNPDAMRYNKTNKRYETTQPPRT